jgi:sulfur-carrier protein
MATNVFIPASLRRMTGGVREVSVEAETVREVIDRLEAEFPGIRERLCEGDRLKPGISVAINSQVRETGLLERVPPGSEVHFIPSVSGG